MLVILVYNSWAKLYDFVEVLEVCIIYKYSTDLVRPSVFKQFAAGRRTVSRFRKLGFCMMVIFVYHLCG